MKSYNSINRNVNQISTPSKYQKNFNQKYSNNSNLKTENQRLKYELNQKTREIQEYRRKIQNLKNEINSLSHNNNNYHNNRNYESNNRINYDDYDFNDDFDDGFIGLNNLMSRLNPFQNINNRFNPGDFVSDYDYENAQLEQNIIDQLCPNPDNMTYEELLALEDKVGNVSKGLTKNQIKKIPVVYFSKYKFKNCDTKCAVCQYDFKEGEKVTKLTCNHLFHAPCVDEWLLKNKICPICKKEIKV